MQTASEETVRKRVGYKETDHSFNMPDTVCFGKESYKRKSRDVCSRCFM